MIVAEHDPIRMRRLANGITLAYQPMPWLHTLSIAFLVPAGSAADPDGLEGSAAVLSDWLSRGAGGRDSREFNEALDGLGVRRGGSAGRELSSVTASMLAKAFPRALPLLTDMLRRPTLADDEFEGARQLAQQELAALDDNPGQRLHELLVGRYFTSPHRRTVYGTAEGLQALRPEALRDDYHRRYGPAGMVVTAAGGGSWQELEGLVEECFGDWRGSPPELPAAAVESAARHHVEADTSQVQIGLAYGGPAPRDPAWYRNSLAMNVLSAGMGSRLFTQVREKRGLAYSVHASSRALRGFGYVEARAGTTPDRAAETLTVILDEIARLREGVRGDELERARTGILSQLVMQGESSGARAVALAHDIHLRGEPRSLGTIKEAVAAVTLDEVNDYLAGQAPPQPTVVTLGPSSAMGA